MIHIGGKQISDNTISQNNMFIETNSIISGTSITNKDYVIQQINEKLGGIYQGRLNQHMTANNATIGQRASNIAIIEFPISNILVKINGTIVNVGESFDCYFSPDGITIRTGGNGQKGDYLYWNSNKYNLSTDDEIDLNYLVAYDYYTLSGGTSITLNPVYNNLVVKYTGDSGTTMTVIIDGVSILVGNSGGSFVWDIGGDDEYIFTTSNESIVININGNNYTIWWDGFGSLIFSVKKGGEIIDDRFTTEWNISNVSFTFPTTSFGGGVFDYYVDWGDGSEETHVTSSTSPTHTYPSTGTYQIKVRGSLPYFIPYNNSTSRISLTKIIKWGNVNFRTFNNSFRSCINLNQLPVGPITSSENVTDFGSMFYGCTFTTIPDNLFDNCVNAISMGGLFQNNSSLTTIPNNLFDNCTGVTNFYQTFYSCTALRSIPNRLFYYNSLCTSYNNVFMNCVSINLPSEIWNISNLVARNASLNKSMYVSNTSNSFTGTVQDIWNYYNPLHTSCFKNNILLTNYSSIPADWK